MNEILELLTTDSLTPFIQFSERKITHLTQCTHVQGTYEQVGVYRRKVEESLIFRGNLAMLLNCGNFLFKKKKTTFLKSKKNH